MLDKTPRFPPIDRNRLRRLASWFAGQIELPDLIHDVATAAEWKATEARQAHREQVGQIDEVNSSHQHFKAAIRRKIEKRVAAQNWAKAAILIDRLLAEEEDSDQRATLRRLRDEYRAKAAEQEEYRGAVGKREQVGSPRKPPPPPAPAPPPSSSVSPLLQRLLWLGAVILLLCVIPVPEPATKLRLPWASSLDLKHREAPLSAEQERELKPGESFKECALCPEMVVIPPGSFPMGSPVGEPWRVAYEDPQHEVTLAQSFAVGRFAVTFDEWDACVADGGCRGFQPSDKGWGRGRRPVIHISYGDAKAYVEWLARKTGKAYRLLSEAEREYVTRAGTNTPFWWGVGIATWQANFTAPKQSSGKTVPVDAFLPNPWGLYQVHGNVFDWTEDCWNNSYRGAPTDGSSRSSGDCSSRVLRGGAWSSPSQVLRAAFRSRGEIKARFDFQGLRVARTLAAAPPSLPAPQPPIAATPEKEIKISPTPLSQDQERALKPKDRFRECDACPEMVTIPPGSFRMGSPGSERERMSDEGPQHTVTFARSFAVGRSAVTFDQWDACVADGGCGGYRPPDLGWGRRHRPVIMVSQDDAKAYVEWLSRKTGKAYRLLSESEREYVSRAGTTTAYWWGDTISTSQANYDGNYIYGDGKKGEYRRQTTPVDSFAPNPWGLYQVHGNVLEWMEDCYHSNYLGAPNDGSAWTSGHCSSGVLRGGAWHDSPKLLRSARRATNSRNGRFPSQGFRVARTLPASPTSVPAAPPSSAANTEKKTAVSLYPLSSDQERALTPKESFKECGVCPEMVVIPPGSFAMGSPVGEKDGRVEEGPVHTVSFAHPFAVGRFAVTFDEWDACIADGGCKNYNPFDQGWGRARQPVINVSYDDARAYVAWLSGKTKKTYRLLSEAEREYVARAGTKTTFWFGNAISPNQANYNGNYSYANGTKGQFRQRTMPVHAFDPNPWGLHQVHGNVWEWTEDCWNSKYSGAPVTGMAWTSGNCSRRVIRGGSWVSPPTFLRAATRLSGLINLRDNSNGFRVARAISPTKN
jgi:formylglycine-generating enzyme required for sulfatase activity